jgi:tyrosinase
VTKAPVWDDQHGFGTTGVAEQSERAILNGYCVEDGPFKDFVIPYLDAKDYPHCLSRGFAQGEELKNQSKMVSPNVIEDLLSLDSYNAFNLGLEHGPHLAIPRSIRGDFSLLTAPSGELMLIARNALLMELSHLDPVFFLHHAQLDRLWWKWQVLHPKKSAQYEGVVSHRSKEQASPNDLLKMGDLAPDIAVAQIIDTQSDFLRYHY